MTVKWASCEPTPHGSASALCLSKHLDTLDEGMRSDDRLGDDEGVYNGSAFSDRSGCGKTSDVSRWVALHSRGKRYIEWVRIQSGWSLKERPDRGQMVVSDAVP